MPRTRSPSDTRMQSFPMSFSLGDANHCVSPFAGNGASLALNDGWDLARQLCESSSLKEAITAYDALVESRSREVLKQSHYAIALAHARGWKAWVYLVVIRLVAWLFLRNQIDVTQPETGGGDAVEGAGNEL